MQKIKIYFVTCARPDMRFEEQAEQACRGGADVVIFGDAKLSDRELVETGQKMKALCRKRKVSLMVHRRADLALAVDADGVHLDHDGIPVDWARHILGPRRLIGFSASTLGQALAGAEAGVNYVTAGQVFASSAGEEKEAPGLDLIRLIRKRVKVPVIAAGNITMENLAEAIGTGADGVAVSRALWGAASVETAIQEMKRVITRREEEQARTIQE